MRIKQFYHQNNGKGTKSKDWMLVTDLKGRRSCPCFKIQELHGEERPQQWREWGKRAPPGWVCSGRERGERRGH